MERGFFSIGLPEFRKACELGVNPPFAFLVQAAGTGRDNRTTSWSANAVEKYAGISWVRAKAAIEQLVDAGLSEKAESFTEAKPRYKLQISDERIWLPKSIVMPLDGEVPPIARIRQVQDVMALRLYIELYYSQNLAADGGLARCVCHRRYKKSRYYEHGQYLFLGFDSDKFYTTWGTEITSAHRTKVTDKEVKAGKSEVSEFYKRFFMLRDLGLLEEVAFLFESADKDSEILLPIDGPEEEDREAYLMASAANERLLPDWRIEDHPHEYLIPVPRHQERAELYGVFRLLHRPHTSLTGAWSARRHERLLEARRIFNAVR